ncbi:MAG: EutN/CcmL family microcompartment protein [Candidatus Eisenbacteria bacterium]
MYIGKVIGDVVSSVKHDSLRCHKILIVQPLEPDGKPQGEPILAIDMVDSGTGDTVLIVDQGTAARTVLAMEYPTIRTLILGVVDRIDLGQGEGG